MKNTGAQELEGAVDVTHMDIQNQIDQALPAPGVELAHPRVLAVQAVADDRVVFVDEWKKALQVADIELPVGVHKQGELSGCRREATYQGRSIAQIGGMSDETDTRIGFGKRGNNGSRAIRTAIVDNQHFGIYAPRA